MVVISRLEPITLYGHVGAVINTTTLQVRVEFKAKRNGVTPVRCEAHGYEMGKENMLTMMIQDHLKIIHTWLMVKIQLQCMLPGWQ